MKQSLIMGAAVVGTCLSFVSASQAQVFVRAPFVRVSVGDGVHVRAPFVNIFVPSYGPRVVYSPTPSVIQPQQPGDPEQLPAVPRKLDPNAPPEPVQPEQPLALDAFAKSFQPKVGSYEVTLMNPVTKQPTSVRFTLPEGTPRRVNVSRDSIEFFYALRQWVRIEFDKDGAIVTSR